MIVLGEINLRFRCEVRSLGYRLDGSKDELHPRFPSDKEAKPFETQALQDFFQLGSFLGKEKDIADEGRLRFCNRWGPLWYEGENAAQFDGTFFQFHKAQNERKTAMIPNLNIEAVNIPFNLGELKWTYTSEGRLVPTIECHHLAHALMAVWSFSANDTLVDHQSCKFFKHYGTRKGCSKYFQKSRSNKEFCSPNCKNAFKQKPDWREKE